MLVFALTVTIISTLDSYIYIQVSGQGEDRRDEESGHKTVTAH